MTFDTQEMQSRRDAEFFCTFFALGWWNLGGIALVAFLVPSLRRRIPLLERRACNLSAIWISSTLLIWLVLMFNSGSASIHLGSYAVPLMLFPLFALALWRLHPIAFALVLLAQLAIFPWLWMTAPPAMSSQPVRIDAIVTVVASALALALVVWASEKKPVVAPTGVPS